MVPMIDVMLVLVIIFIVTAPLLQQAIPIRLPNEKGQPIDVRPKELVISISAAGDFFTNAGPRSKEDIRLELHDLKESDSQAVLKLRADQDVAYKHVAALLAMSQNAGITRVGFISQPTAESSGAAK